MFMAAVRSSFVKAVPSKEALIFVAVRSPQNEDNDCRTNNFDLKKENAHGKIYRNRCAQRKLRIPLIPIT